jgi:hypothetical protein
MRSPAAGPAGLRAGRRIVHDRARAAWETAKAAAEQRAAIGSGGSAKVPAVHSEADA